MNKYFAAAFALMMILLSSACKPLAGDSPGVSGADVSGSGVSGSDVSGSDVSDSDDPDPSIPFFVGGEYVAVSAEKEDGSETDLNGDIICPVFSFNKDGTGTVTQGSQSGAVKWTLENDLLTVSEEDVGVFVEFTVQDDRLVTEIFGVKIVYARA